MAQASGGKAAIGFIGLGYMGQGMAKNLLAAGHPLTVRGRRNRAPVERLTGLGATEADSPRAVAEAAEIVHLCLSDSRQVEEVIRGPGGILEARKPGLVVIDTTTADPSSTLALAAEMAAAGMTLVDAPLGRTPREAEAGTLDAMVGASPEMFARLRPVIACWAGNIRHCGPVGSGHRMKLVMNFISMGYAALYAEALVLATKSGLAPQAMRDVIGSSRLSNGFFETFMAHAVDRAEAPHRFTIDNAAKDVGYAARMAAEAGAALPLGAIVNAYFTQAKATGHGAAYVPEMADLIAALSGLDLAAAAQGKDRP